MPREIPLTKGEVALLDDEDYDYLSQWCWRLNSHRIDRSPHVQLLFDDIIAHSLHLRGYIPEKSHDFRRSMAWKKPGTLTEQNCEICSFHPDWPQSQLAAALGRSLSWVKKWCKRLRHAYPNVATVLRVFSRARKTSPQQISETVIQCILEIRREPPDRAAVPASEDRMGLSVGNRADCHHAASASPGTRRRGRASNRTKA
jgi:hypothetical protein